MNAEVQYLQELENILEHGTRRSNRTGVDTISHFGSVIRHDYKEGFPLLTTKKIFTKSVIHELLWFLKGTEDAQYLIDNNVHIWDGWMKEENGKKILPHTYGTKWRNFHGKDQIKSVIDEIKNHPDSRRMIVSAWDAANVENAALPWCHVIFKFYIEKDTISIAVWQRSADFFLGVPFNLASYSFLLYMIAEVTGYKPKSMFYTFVDSHVYVNHIDQCKFQLERKPYNLPNFSLKRKDNIDDFVFEDFSIQDYQCHPFIKGEVAI